MFQVLSLCGLSNEGLLEIPNTEPSEYTIIGGQGARVNCIINDSVSVTLSSSNLA